MSVVIHQQAGSLGAKEVGERHCQHLNEATSFSVHLPCCHPLLASDSCLQSISVAQYPWIPRCQVGTDELLHLDLEPSSRPCPKPAMYSRAYKSIHMTYAYILLALLQRMLPDSPCALLYHLGTLRQEDCLQVRAFDSLR